MSLSNQIRNSRRVANDSLIQIDLGTLAKEIRTEDSAVTKTYNKQVEEWAEQQKLRLRSSVNSRIRRNVSLSDSIRERVYYNREGGKEAVRIGFAFLREGIYVHKGAGRGQAGVIGSSWIDRHGVKKHTNPASFGKMATGNRQPLPWFDDVMEKKLPQLADIVAEYSATLQVDATKLYLDQ